MKNIFGDPLIPCCTSPMTGYFRDGYCRTDLTDVGLHIVCAYMTEDFLRFSKTRGNDLSTPVPAYDFPGLKPGDFWCLCALRWVEAYRSGCAPFINLEATSEKVLEIVEESVLLRFAYIGQV
ncbi:MAG: DUF2237 domain-containing protein [Bacteroidetes bacterium]|nr:DUF2237 domain-containing protein [Bacteroidota bacterium]MBM3424645.1 DUF2237 domain-containing protein [Bacteroidota bacterium]